MTNNMLNIRSQNLVCHQSVYDTRFLLRKAMRKNYVHRSVNLSPSSPRQRRKLLSIDKQKKYIQSSQNSGVKRFHIKKNGNKVEFCATQNIFVYKNKKKVAQKLNLQQQLPRQHKKFKIPIVVTKKTQAFRSSKIRVINNCKKIQLQWNIEKIDRWDSNNQPQDEEFMIC